ncbi:Papilin [Trichinella zimbabwensis]|uniref:Papilin n=1 Tax=Trichinella zimbabwensis TaxID=268475 RepID=A0A0V1HRN7_9BILA|nr:Papilin [Trichinella zimbabwensis]
MPTTLRVSTLLLLCSIYSAVLAEIDPCERQLYRTNCPSKSTGKSQSSQFVLRYYRRGSQCVSYPYGLCSATDPGESKLFKTRQQCQEYCLSDKTTPQSNQTNTSPPYVNIIQKEAPKTTPSPQTTFTSTEQLTHLTTTITNWKKQFQTAKPIKSKCEEKREEGMLASRHAGGSKVSIQAAFIPECLPDGSYQPIQCDIFSLTCWCVDQDGIEKTGSRVTGGNRPNCNDSPIGGVILSLHSSCLQSPERGPCNSELKRWYYDPEERQCKEMIYSGCGGNENNFISKDDCQRRCGTVIKGNVCPNWSAALVDEQGNAVQCYEQNCPIGYKCVFADEEAYCCANPQTNDLAAPLMSDDDSICKFPKDRGPCGSFHLRFYYDSTEQECRYFFYGGCGGNRNNFQKLVDCQNLCMKAPMSGDVAKALAELEKTAGTPVVPPDVDNKCEMPKDPGPCRGHFERWYYDQNEAKCKSLIYGGCGGNANNFESLIGCQETCTELDADVCKQPADKGSCRGNFQRWHFDYKEKQCKPFLYGGCLGNGNNFKSRNACEAKCMPETTTQMPRNPCMHPKDPGPCNEHHQRWFFDSASQSCQQFIYGGCGGNGNNFKSHSMCTAKCGAALPENACNHPPDRGDCSGHFVRFFYDHNAESCKQFIYGGCTGNGNNFATQFDCEQKCMRNKISKQTKLLLPGDELCNLQKARGHCNSYELRYYFNRDAGRCEFFFYSGCGGNKNNFKTLAQCELFCSKKSAVPLQFGSADTGSTSETNGQPSYVNSVMPPASLEGYGVENQPTTLYPHQKSSEQVSSNVESSSRAPASNPHGSQSRPGLAPLEPGTETSSIAPAPPAYGDTLIPKQSLPGTAPHQPGMSFQQMPQPPSSTVQEKPHPHISVTPQSPSTPYQSTSQAYSTNYASAVEQSHENIQGIHVSTVYSGLTEGLNSAVTSGTPTAALRHKCDYPRERGPCSDDLKRWYWDKAASRCLPFTYGGCRGNSNNFETEHTCIAECQGRPAYAIMPPAGGAIAEAGVKCVKEVKCLPDWVMTIDENGCERCTYPTPSVVPTTLSPSCVPVTNCPEGMTIVTGADGCKKCVKEALIELETPVPELTTVSDKPCAGDEIECEDMCMQITDKDGCVTCFCPQDKVITTTAAVVTITDAVTTNPTQIEEIEKEEKPECQTTMTLKECPPHCMIVTNNSGCKSCLCPEVTEKPTYLTISPNETQPIDTDEIKAKCYQPLDRGPCFGPAVLRWWYNSETRKCERFEYSSCGGNRNHFYSQKECIAHCESPLNPVVETVPTETTTTENSTTPTVPVISNYSTIVQPAGPVDPYATVSPSEQVTGYGSPGAHPMVPSEYDAFTHAPGTSPKAPGFEDMLYPYHVNTNAPSPLPYSPSSPSPYLTNGEIPSSNTVAPQIETYTTIHHPGSYPYPPATVSTTTSIPSSYPYKPPAKPESVSGSEQILPPAIGPIPDIIQPTPSSQVEIHYTVAPSRPLPIPAFPSPYPDDFDVTEKPQDPRYWLYCPDGEIPMQYKNGTMIRCLPGQNMCPLKSRCYFNGLDYFCCSTATYEVQEPALPSPY